jgi:hypothetical protein
LDPSDYVAFACENKDTSAKQVFDQYFSNAVILLVEQQNMGQCSYDYAKEMTKAAMEQGVS